MIFRKIAFISLFSIFLVAGCESQPKKEQAAPKPTVSSDEVKQKVGEAVETTTEYMLQQSEKYRVELEKKLEDFDRQIEEWKPEIEKAEQAVRERLEQELEGLEEQRELVRKKLEELKEPGKTAWEDVKQGMDNAVNELTQALKKAKKHFER
ncbi:hypothetical protein CSA56_15995 [candidate division KSB3 bacterium]|uniref:Uncharacterized protein n=1 Tax=candidate division KSB3 bacterium TaxID=2044937 RepID=A0A2G6K9B7_9BACT|nr:MAG: hypothetical protein CSA56_15995 [candidate division KSB3 bacterium]